MLSLIAVLQTKMKVMDHKTTKLNDGTAFRGEVFRAPQLISVIGRRLVTQADSPAVHERIERFHSGEGVM